LAFPLSPPPPLLPCGNVGSNGDDDNGDGGSGDINNEETAGEMEEVILAGI
jgi:hypothetical protein